MKLKGKDQKEENPNIPSIDEFEEKLTERINKEVERLKKKISKLLNENDELKKLVASLSKTEQLTETEQEVLDDIIVGRLAQYPLITKGKNPHKYAKTHKRTASLKKKLLRMGLLPHD